MLFGLLIPRLVNTILWHSIEWFELMPRMSLAGLTIYSCWTCILGTHSCVFHTVAFIISSLINLTLQMVNWSEEVIVSDFEEPSILTPASKRKTAVGLVIESNSLKHKHQWSHANTLAYITTPFCTGKSQKLKQFLQYQHNLALFANCCPITFEILAARDRHPALAVDIWSSSNGASNAN